MIKAAFAMTTAITIKLAFLAAVLSSYDTFVVTNAVSDGDGPAAPPGTNANDESATNAEYEAKLDLAMKYFAEQSERALRNAFNEGLVDVDSTGNIENGAANEQMYVDFATKALSDELGRVDKIAAVIDSDEDFNYADEGDFEGDVYVEGEDLLYMDEVEDSDDDGPPETKEQTIQRELDVRASLNPAEWYRFDYWDLHAYFTCEALFLKSRPSWSNEKWMDMREYYREFVEQDKIDKPLDEGQGERSYSYSEGSYDPPMEPYQSQDRGRGLIAMRDISKGEMVFKATNNTIIFTHGHTWRKFLFAIYERDEEELDAETTCDILVWSWIQQLEPDGPLRIVMDLDNGSLLNEGRNEEGWDPPNVRCGKEGERCEMAYYALSDIKKGDELLCDYREFALLDAWSFMGL